MLNYKSPRDAIEFVVNGYFSKKRLLANQRNSKSRSGTNINTAIGYENLPTLPFGVFKDENNKIEKIIYGNIELLGQENIEADIIIWQEEFIREDGKIIQIERTFPDGETGVENIIRDDGKVIGMN